MLKDGSYPGDPRLDRLVQFDERSRGFPIQVSIEEATRPRLRSHTWDLPKPYVIDQGSEGACVGFAITNELLARPALNRFGGVYQATRFAVQSLYWPAQMIDPWPGGAYPGASPYYEGTSVLAGVKVAKSLGFFTGYRWAFSLEELIYGLAIHGPAVLGLNWYEGMFQPDAEGFIRPEGRIAGGHAILARGVYLVWARNRFFPWRRTFADIDLNQSYVLMRNSWGEHYGDRGDCRIALVHLERLLKEDGEAVFFQGRKHHHAPVNP
jgi:hypothetical protein